MAKIIKYGITFHSDFKLLMPQFSAITLFGHVFTKMTKTQLEQYLNTTKGHTMANHEFIHILQADTFKTRYIGFYIYYLYYWIKNLLTWGPNMKAYYAIPFEMEAYQNENDFGFYKSNWKNYR